VRDVFELFGCGFHLGRCAFAVFHCSDFGAVWWGSFESLWQIGVPDCGFVVRALFVLGLFMKFRLAPVLHSSRLPDPSGSYRGRLRVTI
jgi:hypothetical protein